MPAFALGISQRIIHPCYIRDAMADFLSRPKRTRSGGFVLKKSKLIAIFVGLMLLFTTTGASCDLFGSGTNTADLPQVTLTVWRLFDDKEVFDPIVENYQSARGNQVNIVVNYIKKDYADYIDNAVNAIAARKGPDILMLRNDWLPQHYEKLVAAPSSVITLDEYKTRFPDVVIKDNTNANGEIFGMPLSMDTLVLYYNKDMFKAMADYYEEKGEYDYARANFENPPWDWTSLVNISKEFTVKDGNQIKRSGIAMGTANNVDKAEDILSAIMLQNSTAMLDQNYQNATFNLSVKKESGELYYPGTKALDFYTAFANPDSSWYTWNDTMPNSVDAFIQGKAAMLINYPFLKNTFAKQAPNLNYGVGPLPQIVGAEKAVDYATYWVETVTNNSANPAWAWDFINYISTNYSDGYLSSSGRTAVKRIAESEVPQIRDRINNNPLVYEQATAQTWFKGYYPERINSIFKEMIDNVAIHKQNSQNAIDKAALDITTLITKKPY